VRARVGALQDFTVLLTEISCRFVIQSLSVIFLSTTSPIEKSLLGFLSSVIPNSIAISVGKKNICWWFYRKKLCVKKKFSHLKYTDELILSVIGQCRQTNSLGNFVGECVKYRQKIYVYTFIGDCGSYCEMLTY